MFIDFHLCIHFKEREEAARKAAAEAQYLAELEEEEARQRAWEEEEERRRREIEEEARAELEVSGLMTDIFIFKEFHF